MINKPNKLKPQLTYEEYVIVIHAVFTKPPTKGFRYFSPSEHYRPKFLWWYPVDSSHDSGFLIRLQCWFLRCKDTTQNKACQYANTWLTGFYVQYRNRFIKLKAMSGN